MRWPSVSREARLLWPAVLAFVAMTAWWLTQDTRIPDYDSAAHGFFAVVVHRELSLGRVAAPFTDYNSYPPLVHLLGGISIFVTGPHPAALILSSDLVFVPLLAFGCLGVGRIVFGPRAGLLAALVALGSPMFVSMMHEYDLDPPQAAMIAVSLWALLASNRFASPWRSALAGGLAGLALMTKQTSIVFLAGPVAVIVIRGGWRHRAGLLRFLYVLAAVAGPWYVYHWHELVSTFTTIGGNAGLAAGSVQLPPRFSGHNYTWYGWDLVNQQVLAPFTLSFLIGCGTSVWRLLHRQITSASYEPELLVGAVFSYAGMTYLTHKDPRYTLPMLVYVAVLATGWVARIPRPGWRAVLSGTVVALSALYFVGMSMGIGGRVGVRLPGAQANMIYRGELTLYETDGWVRGGPVHDADLHELLAGLRQAGIEGIAFETGDDPLDFSRAGLTMMAISEGLAYRESPPFLTSNPPLPASVAPLPPTREAYLVLRTAEPGDPPPCQRLNDGRAIYVVRGPAGGIDFGSLKDPTDARRHYSLLCPGRAPVRYP